MYAKRQTATVKELIFDFCTTVETNKMRQVFTFFLLISTLVVVFAQSDDVRKKNYNVKKNIALEGYDPISYFDHKPTVGKGELKFSHRGITYLFASVANLNTFKAAPENYEPAYGGWCAYAMGDSGEKVKVDPETFKILSGRLYLFYNSWGTNTLTDWNKSEKPLKSKGGQNWKKFIP